ncbi:MAG: hypothetical protein ACPG5T_02910, partial [Endozoicomonas sp.]
FLDQFATTAVGQSILGQPPSIPEFYLPLKLEALPGINGPMVPETNPARKVPITVTGFVAVPRLMEKMGAVAVLPCAATQYYQPCYVFSWHPMQDGDPGLIWLRQEILTAAQRLKD